jgi:hypothetical protein
VIGSKIKFDNDLTLSSMNKCNHFFNSCAVGHKTGPLCQTIYRGKIFSQKAKTFLCGDGGSGTVARKSENAAKLVKIAKKIMKIQKNDF